MQLDGKQQCYNENVLTCRGKVEVSERINIALKTKPFSIIKSSILNRLKNFCIGRLSKFYSTETNSGSIIKINF